MVFFKKQTVKYTNCFFFKKKKKYTSENIKWDTFAIPVITNYLPRTKYLKDNLPSAINSATQLDLRLLSGHLGQQDVQTDVVTTALNYLTNNPNPKRIRIRGPSGSGKTKALYDICKKLRQYYVIIDWSRNDYDIVMFLKAVQDLANRATELKKKRSLESIVPAITTIRDSMEYELVLLIAARAIASKHFQTKCKLSSVDWLHYQLNGFGSIDYHGCLDGIQRCLRAIHPTINDLHGVVSKETPRLVVVQDEVNVLSQILSNHFDSERDGTTECRPLLSFVLNKLFRIPVLDYVLAGTGIINAHLEASVIAKNVNDTTLGCLLLDTRYLD